MMGEVSPETSPKNTMIQDMINSETRWRYITDKHRSTITLSAMKRWNEGQFEKTIKELSQFDDKKPEEFELKFDHFDLDNSYPSSPFKGRNIVDLDFV